MVGTRIRSGGTSLHKRVCRRAQSTCGVSSGNGRRGLGRTPLTEEAARSGAGGRRGYLRATGDYLARQISCR